MIPYLISGIGFLIMFAILFSTLKARPKSFKSGLEDFNFSSYKEREIKTRYWGAA